MRTRFKSYSAVVVVLLVLGRIVLADSVESLQSGFQNPPDDSRIMMRWWWFGPSVEKPELEREMRVMKEGGIGGFEVQPVYPLVLDDERKGIKNYQFLSPQYLDALRFTADKAHELGLRFDLTLGSGWPFGGPGISIDNAAGRLRYEHVKVDHKQRFVKVPSIGAGETLIATFVARAEGSSFAQESIKEVTPKEGVISTVGLADSYEVLFFISSRTGMQVKRPALGAEGFVLDHLNRKATDFYLKAVGDRLMSAFGSNRPYAIFCDSLEVYNSDWSNDFLEEFQRRRGYDLKPYLPALVNEMGPQTKALRHDWGQTLTELLNERFLQPIQQWASKNKTLFRIQNYGVPASALSSSEYADLPEGEGSQWKILRAARWASSASHLYSRTVTSSETWTWLHSPAFRATPLDVKAEADLHFLQGINQLIGHGWPYTPPGVEYPGWRFYAAAAFGEKNPWWIAMPDIAKYLQRVSFMMRQGQPANDVAVYLPNDDAWSHMPVGNPHLLETLKDQIGTELLPAIFNAGYSIDFFDSSALKKVGRVEGGSLVLGQNKYKVVVLPGVEQISVETYETLKKFVDGGGVLIATRRTPSEAPGFRTTAEMHKQILDITKSLFQSPNKHVRLVANENVDLISTLRSLVHPDLELMPASPDVGFVHRRTAEVEIYFVVNTSNTAQRLKVSSPNKMLTAEMWNPLDGTVRKIVTNPENDDSGTFPLFLEPYGSRLLVFTKRLFREKGTDSRKSRLVLDMSRDWNVSVGDVGAVKKEKLNSWTEDESTRFFSGEAIYEKEISIQSKDLNESNSLSLEFGEGIPITPQPLRNGMQAWLDGPVREAAVVYINSKRAGSVWCPPYSVDVTRFLRPGINNVRIVVANTAMNYMAGHSLPDYKLLNLRYGERFQAQDMDKIQPLPSGILGPIKLVSTPN